MNTKKMWTLLLSGFLILVLMTVFMGGCGKATDNSVINLKFSSDLPEMAAPSRIVIYFMDYIEKNSDGKVKFERFFGGVLGAGPEQTNLVKTGAVDLGGGGINEAEFPLHSAYPQFVRGSAKAGVDFQTQIELGNSETSKLLQQEWTDNNIKYLGALPSGENGFIAKFKFTSLADLKGKKLGVDSGRNQKIFSSLGPTGVVVQIPDMYEALSRGLVDAASLSLGGMVDMGWYETCQCYMSDLTYSAGHTRLPLVNLKKWNSFPKDIQQVFQDAAKATTEYALKLTQEDDAKYRQKLVESGLTVGELSEADRAKEYDAFIQIWYKDSMDNANKLGKGDKAQIIWDNVGKMLNITLPE